MTTPGPGTFAASSQLVPLDDDGSVNAMLPCPCISMVHLTPEQVQGGLGILTTCAGCDGHWTLVPVTGQLMTALQSQHDLPAGYILVLTVMEPV